MKNKFRILAALAALIFVLTGCGEQAAVQTAEPAASAQPTESTVGAVTPVDTKTDVETDTDELFSSRDYEIGYDETTAARITLNGSSIECDDDTVTVEGSVVTISDEGTYILTGTLNDGMVIVNAEKTDKLQLVLDGASISSATSAAIYVKQADKVFITLAPGSVNSLSNGGEFVSIDDKSIDAALFSCDDLTFNGQGSLSISSPAGHGIVCKDDLVITGGSFTLDCAGHGVCGKDSVSIADGSFNISAGKDGFQAENDEDAASGCLSVIGGSFTLNTTGDGFSASGKLLVAGGSFNIVSGGGSASVTKSGDDWSWGKQNSWQGDSTDDSAASAKGFKADGALTVTGGSLNIDSADDGLHAGGTLTVSGGTLTIASGDDGIHSDALTAISGGTVNITDSYEGIEGLCIEISGGDVTLKASNDGLNAAGGTDQSGFGGFGGFGGGSMEGSDDNYIVISGGTLNIDASGDGVDSNGALTVTGGSTYVSGPTNGGNGALDYGSDASISGGVFIAAGATGMEQNFGSSSTQGAMLVSTGSQSAGSTVTLTDSSGKQLLSWTAAKSYGCVVISCPELVAGESYTVTAGRYSGEITLSELIYGGGSGMMGGWGGKGGTHGGFSGSAPADMPTGEIPSGGMGGGKGTRPGMQNA